ncbi:hypothetical protein Syun_030215 [Stephania yunnanensis]|uniref:Uncharacterized protein n=1 Tax=Stephania yunnanensis TaxID=152371 RepID=A0AAP0E753_9MAGN
MPFVLGSLSRSVYSSYISDTSTPYGLNPYGLSLGLYHSFCPSFLGSFCCY